MPEKSCHKNFPLKIVILRAALFIGLLATLSAIVLLQSSWLGAGYLFGVVTLFMTMMSLACTRCDYYDGTCDNGLSVLTRSLFKPKPGRRAFGPIAKRFLIPLATMMIIPLGSSIYGLIRAPSLLGTGLLIGLFVLGGLIYFTSTKLACPRCAMHDVCPLGQRFL
jgi:hypothetical protein